VNLVRVGNYLINFDLVTDVYRTDATSSAKPVESAVQIGFAAVDSAGAQLEIMLRGENADTLWSYLTAVMPHLDAKGGVNN
jgi:hypothetical protein